MNGFALLLAVAAVGIDYGWQRTPDGQLEYIIQIEPEMLETLRDERIDIVSLIHPEARDIKQLRIRVGSEPLPKEISDLIVNSAPGYGATAKPAGSPTVPVQPAYQPDAGNRAPMMPGAGSLPGGARWTDRPAGSAAAAPPNRAAPNPTTVTPPASTSGGRFPTSDTPAVPSSAQPAAVPSYDPQATPGGLATGNPAPGSSGATGTIGADSTYIPATPSYGNSPATSLTGSADVARGQPANNPTTSGQSPGGQSPGGQSTVGGYGESGAAPTNPTPGYGDRVRFGSQPAYGIPAAAATATGLAGQGSSAGAAPQPGSGSQPGYGSQSGSGSQPGYGSQLGNGSQPAYGSQPGNGSPPSAALPTGYGAQPPYERQHSTSSLSNPVNPQGYEAQPGYGVQPGYGARVGDDRSPLYGTAADPRNNAADPRNNTADPRYGTADPRYGTADPRYGAADPRYGTADPRYGAADPRYGAADPRYGAGEPRYSGGGITAGQASGIPVPAYDGQGIRYADQRAGQPGYGSSGAGGGQPSYPSLEPPIQSQPAGPIGPLTNYGSNSSQPSAPPRVPVPNSPIDPPGVRGGGSSNWTATGEPAKEPSLWPPPASTAGPAVPSAGGTGTSGSVAGAASTPGVAAGTPTVGLPGDDQRSGGARGNALPDDLEKPWMPLTMTVFALMISLGANAYLAWIALGLHGRYRELVYELRHAQAAIS